MTFDRQGADDAAEGRPDGAGGRRLVSALVPCYNSEAFIDATLKSLAAQTWPDLEILIADDASTDGTRARLEAFARGRSDTRLFFREKNVGWLENTNALMASARGDCMFFAFHDDLVAPDYVEALMTALDGNPDAVIAFSDVALSEIDGTQKPVSFELLEGVRSTFRRGLLMAFEPEGWWIPNRGLFRSSAYRQIGGIRRPKASEVRADWVWLLDMALAGGFVRVPRVLCQKFYQPTSLSKTWTRSAERLASTRQAAIDAVMSSRLTMIEKAVLASLIFARLVGRYTARKLWELRTR
jgi:glycosyltransferase involved in cell wall biosynthesis